MPEPPRPMPDPFRSPFPSLPIVTPGAPGRSVVEKYGTFFYLGTAGLAVVVVLVAWFAWSAWSLRSLWENVYALHDPKRPEAERVQAAYDLSRDPRATPRQLWDVALRKDLPPLARYVVAEGLTADAASDPRGYGVSVARSEGWPDWLRVLLVRPLAYRAAAGLPVPREPLDELSRNPDAAVGLWAKYALAASLRGDDPSAAADLRSAAGADGLYQTLARHLLTALDAVRPTERLLALDAATLWLRRNHPEAARVWSGWEVTGGRLIRASTSAPELH